MVTFSEVTLRLVIAHENGQSDADVVDRVSDLIDGLILPDDMDGQLPADGGIMIEAMSSISLTGNAMHLVDGFWR